jgi:hypothetical protein
MTLEQRYASKSGWDTAQWLNTHADQSDRVAVERFTFYPWFLRPEILRSSESREERSQLHAARGRNGAGPVSSAEWLLLQRWGYRYVIVPPNHLESSVREFPGDRPPALAFAGNGAVVLRLSSAAPRGEP